MNWVGYATCDVQEVKHMVFHTRVIKTKLYDCNLDGRFHRACAKSEMS